MIRVLLICCFAIFFLEVSGNCPDKTFYCPTGERFTIGTCWQWSSFSCQTCRSITSEMKNKCRKYSCYGSTSRWYGRNDGCSAGPIAGPLTLAFRAACAIHDICYATPDRPKSSCDNEFRDNMITTCGFAGALNYVGYVPCVTVAGSAYLFVKDHASNFPEWAAGCTPV